MTAATVVETRYEGHQGNRGRGLGVSAAPCGQQSCVPVCGIPMYRYFYTVRVPVFRFCRTVYVPHSLIVIPFSV